MKENKDNFIVFRLATTGRERLEKIRPQFPELSLSDVMRIALYDFVARHEAKAAGQS